MLTEEAQAPKREGDLNVMMYLDFRTAAIGTVQFAIGLSFWSLGQYLSRNIKGRFGGAVLSWPCYGVALIFLSGAALTILWNMVGPTVLWVLSFAS